MQVDYTSVKNKIEKNEWKVFRQKNDILHFTFLGMLPLTAGRLEEKESESREGPRRSPWSPERAGVAVWLWGGDHGEDGEM